MRIFTRIFMSLIVFDHNEMGMYTELSIQSTLIDKKNFPPLFFDVSSREKFNSFFFPSEARKFLPCRLQCLFCEFEATPIQKDTNCRRKDQEKAKTSFIKKWARFTARAPRKIWLKKN